MASRSLNNKNILVVGGAGFIGSHLCEKLLERDVKTLTVIDNFFTSVPSNIENCVSNKCFDLVQDDARDLSILEKMISERNIDVVFDCATQPLNYSFINPRSAFEINTIITLNQLEIQRKDGFSTLCHFSTSEVYGTANSERMSEKHDLAPTTPYAAGKLAADMAIRTYTRTFDLDCIIIRPFNNFGPRQNYKPPLAGIIPLTINRLQNHQSPILLGDGQQSRDFIFVKDTAQQTLDLFEVLPRGEIVNLAAKNELTMLKLIMKLQSIMNTSIDIKWAASRKSDVQRHRADTSYLETLINPVFTDFDFALGETVNWYNENAV